MRYQVKQRMDFILSVLKEKGTLNRSDLTKQFNISTPQASLDIKMFLKLYPKILTYDPNKKHYIFNPQH